MASIRLRSSMANGAASRVLGLAQNAMPVPAAYRGFGQQVVPMFAGRVLPWSVKA